MASLNNGIVFHCSDLGDSGRSSPIATANIRTSLRAAERESAPFDFCIISPSSGVYDVNGVIQKVTSAMVVLQQSFEDRLLLDGLQVLKEVLETRNEECLIYLQDNQVHLQVIAVLNHLPESLAIQRTGLNVLQLLCKKNTNMVEAMLNSGVNSLIIERMQSYKGDQYIQEHCLLVIAELLNSELYRVFMLSDDHRDDIMSGVCHVIKAFSDVTAVLQAAIQVIVTCIDRQVLPGEQIRNYFMRHVGIHIADCLKNGQETTHHLRLLTLLVREHAADHLRMLTEKDLHFTLMELCARYPGDTGLMPAATELLSFMNQQEVVQDSLTDGNFVQNGLFGIMEVLRVSGHIQKSGLKIIETLIPRLMEDTSRGPDTTHYIVKAVYSAMFTHIDQMDVQIAGCRTLSVLLERRQDAHMWIGENIEENQDPVHNLVVGALLSFSKDAEVFVSASEAIFWIAADNERLCTMLMNKNVHIAIIDGLRRFRKTAVAVETGCRALRGLCIFLHDHKVAVVRDDIFSLLTDLQQRYKTDADVQIEVLSAIACLADVDVVRYQCLVERIPEKIISCMRQFPNVLMIQEAGLEAFSVLAGAEGGSDILLKTGALSVSLEIMNKELDNALIVKKGLIVLQLFASPTLAENETTRLMIVTIIYTALNNFTDLKGVQTEACVAIQLLAEADSAMSAAFIETDCHHCLFEILENDAAPGLQELASECLYVLSQEQNLKSSMLLSACRKGMLPATECLIELGADVNVGTHKSTPLFLAVNFHQEHIVRALLRQGIQDLHTPLRQSLRLNSHATSGLILQQLGHDRDNGVICWSCLELNTLEAMWIITTLTNKQSISADADIGRVYINKIKHGEQRRRRRKLAYSKSDSNLRYPHVRLRHQIVYEQRQDSHISNSLHSAPQLHRTSLSSASMSPYNTKRIFVRSRSMDEGSMLVRNSRQPSLPTIRASSPPENPVVPVFDMSPTEEEEWKEMTLSGANVSYSWNDPRLHPSPNTMRRISSETGLWRRKGSRTSRGSLSSDEESRATSPHFMLRRMSSSMIPDAEKSQRPLSAESITTSIETTVPRETPLVLFDASENVIVDIEALVSNDLKPYLVHLEKVDLRSNRITNIPDKIDEHLPSLQHLDLSSNELAVYPESILRCKRLKELRLSANKMKDIRTCDAICNVSIRILDLSKNQIKALPEKFGRHYPSLEELSFSHNDLMELPNTPLGLPELQVLDLAHNDIDTLPDEFLLMCSKLDSLDLSYNKLNMLPMESCALHLPMLSKMNLRHNHLADKSPFYLPRFLLELPSLRTIDVSENGLTGLPALSMWRTKTMKDFVASCNQIQYLCLKDAELWSKLEKLHLAHNNLSELPKEIGTFTCLLSLDISYNKNITSLPDQLGKCSNIYEMPIAGLDLDLNRSVLQRRAKDIINYLHNRLNNSKRYYRMKLMVVGYGGRGKTTLLKTLMKEKQKKKKENRPTVGVVVKDWMYPRMEKRHRDETNHWLFGSAKRVEYTLSTWDFAGQEEFYSTHNCYLSNRAIYLVVFALHRGQSECDLLKSWLCSIRSRAPGCPVIVVGTHLDKVPNDSRGDKEIRKITEMLREFNVKPGFPTISQVVLVNASMDDENMEQLRMTIKHSVDKFEIRGRRVMGEKIPESYVQLADMLTSRVQSPECEYPVLNQKELLELMEENNLAMDENELYQAVQFLHECGVLLHYDDSSLQLKEYYFIDPGWLCRMMAQVITVRQINPFINPDGILRKRDIDVLFKDSNKFPKTLIPQYIKLLEKFEIALPHTDTELLIPCRLPKQRPHIVKPAHGHIERIYRMPFAPIGLWFRLIARMISLFSHAGFNAVTKASKIERSIYWRNGMYVFWNETKYCLLDSAVERDLQMESIIITVPASCPGMRLLGQIVDDLDNLIDEWYPGLTSIDPMMGQEILEVLAPCTQCQGSTPFMFTISELQKTASSRDFIRCPQHDGDVLLTELAPDLVLGDMEFELKLDRHAFIFEESSANQLGDGGFGDVYRAEYRGKVVAAKVFKEIADVHPLKMLRQEVTILRCLNHPSVVSLLAVDIRPPVIVIEYAAHDTLARLCKNNDIFNKKQTHVLKRRIALQVAEGLQYLRSIMIVFRDMKPDNVLIFNTSLDSPINAKIADYGIARFTTMQGLRAQEGTPGFRAPEVIRKENYSFQADIFSFGLTLYVMLTGRHPFHYMGSRGEMDRAIAEGRRIPPPETMTSTVLPDMRLLTMSCLKFDPLARPTAGQLWRLLARPEVDCLRRKIPVSRSTTVECQAVEMIQHEGRQDMRLWIASGDSESFQLSYMDLNDASSKTKGLLFNYGRILCMQPLGGHRMAIGTQLGKVWLFDTVRCKILNASSQLEDSVLCMNLYRKNEKDDSDVLLVGLANGRVAIFTVQEMLHKEDLDPVCLYPGYEYEPVLCMTRQGVHVYVSCGAQLVVLNTTKGIMIDKIISTSNKRDPSVAPIYTLAVVKGQIIFSKKSSTLIEIWDVHKDKFQKSFAAEDLFGISKADARVTAMSADNKSLWVGTHGGYIAVVEIKSFTVLAVTKRYSRAVRSLEHVRFAGASQHKAVFSGGLGYMDIFQSDTQKESLYGCVLVWDADLPQQAKAMAEYERKRRALQDTETSDQSS